MMLYERRYRSVGLVSAVALSVALPSVALGQDNQAEASNRVGLEEIIVTAQKRQESLQDTPISISVLGTEQLEARGVSGIQDLFTGGIPSVRTANYAGRSSTLQISMRGISSGEASQISRDGAIGIYIDGVYLGRVQGLGTELLDLERIEVLRGPQGTLFGRNAVGGALNIISKRPTGELRVSQKVGVRNFEGWESATHIDLPKFANISMKIDGVVKQRGGWVDNPMRGEWDFYQYKRWGFRVAALWEPTDTIDVFYSYDRAQDKTVGNYGQITALVGDAPPLAPIFYLEPHRVRKARVGMPLQPSVGKTQGHSLTASWDVTDNLEIKSISAWRKMRQSQYDQYGGTFYAFEPNGAAGRVSLANVRQRQFSQELQLIGSTDRLKYVLGAFYFDEKASDDADALRTFRFNEDGTAITILNPPISSVGLDRASRNRVKSTALFGQVTWTPGILDDRLHLTGGLRYTHDKKAGEMTILRGVSPVPRLAYTFSSKRLDPAATIAFDWTDNVNTYVRWGIAYRAGGANSRSATFRTFNEEEVETWEIGLKSDLWDRRARVNVALYHTAYKDMQVDFVSPLNPSANETLNSDNVTKIKGAEVDLTFQLARGLTTSINYVYTDVKIPDQLNPYSGRFQVTRPRYTPKHAASVSVDYSFPPFSFGVLSAHLDGSMATGSYVEAGDTTKSKGYAMLNGRLTLGEMKIAGAGEFSISLWGKNLFNEEYDVFDYPYVGAGLAGVDQRSFNEPRTYGLEASLRF